MKRKKSKAESQIDKLNLEISRLNHLLKLVTDTTDRAKQHLIRGLTTEISESSHEFHQRLLAMRTETMIMARHELSSVLVILSHQHIGPNCK